MYDIISLFSLLGSGKTVAAELAMFRVFDEYPGGKCVYIAPLKALVRERIEDWSVSFGQKLRRRYKNSTTCFSPPLLDTVTHTCSLLLLVV